MNPDNYEISFSPSDVKQFSSANLNLNDQVEIFDINSPMIEVSTPVVSTYYTIIQVYVKAWL